ncbi:hypothetical protein [Tumebacillus algifaecis]|uniref:hypothetical protein n=1 Tax=Tumebacillus algifaecis TaxID=1214604 RepID=UPI0012FD8F94|nr:hypothetical protein [Tumebacillus algifaecis]
MKKCTGVILLVVILLAIGLMFAMANQKFAAGVALFTGAEQVLVAESEHGSTYLVRAEQGMEWIKAHLAEQGWAYTDQMGAELLFERADGQRLHASVRRWARYFQEVQIEIPEAVTSTGM